MKVKNSKAVAKIRKADTKAAKSKAKYQPKTTAIINVNSEAKEKNENSLQEVVEAIYVYGFWFAGKG